LDPIPIEESKQLVIPSSSTKIPPLALNSESGHQMSQKVLTKLLSHAGFEGAKLGALNVLTDIMTDYITNIGKTLRYYWDDYGHQMDGDVRHIFLLYSYILIDASFYFLGNAVAYIV
jgi:transcriptional activator SPT7